MVEFATVPNVFYGLFRYSVGGELDEGVKHASVFPHERHGLGLCECVH